jgi:hypothetical protein
VENLRMAHSVIPRQRTGQTFYVHSMFSRAIMLKGRIMKAYGVREFKLHRYMTDKVFALLKIK